MRSGDCVGVNLKTSATKNEPGANKWVMLLAVDFASGKIFTWAIDCGKVTVEGVQSRLVGDFVQNDDPAAILRPGNGGQVDTVLEQPFQELLYRRCTCIPPGDPASNGNVEVFKRILIATHGGE